MDEDCWRKVFCYVPDWHVGDELVGFGARVPAGDFLRPDAVLATVLVERAAIALALARVGDGRAANLHECFLPRELYLMMTRVRTGPAVPVSDQVAVSPERKQYGWAGLDTESSRQRQVSPR